MKNVDRIGTYSIRVLGLLLACAFALNCEPVRAAAVSNRVDIPDTGWRLWLDRDAHWKDDDLFLPSEVQLATLPVNLPTGGWEILDSSRGKEVVLPSTVEQHFWGQFGLRPYSNEYYFEKSDDKVQNGNVPGVSWWWTTVRLPENVRGKKILLHVRGARLRAEVFLNRQLVGYDLIEQTSFTCDVSKAALPGQSNLLAIRITNPGGRLDWLDDRVHSWGKYKFYSGRGFGGLDRGLHFSVHDPVYLDDFWVLNTPQPQTVKANAIIRNDTPAATQGTLLFELYDPNDGNRIRTTRKLPFRVDANSRRHIEMDITGSDLALWDLETPHLYKLRAAVKFSAKENGATWRDEREVTFGLRWFETDGIGTDALLRLNGRRIRMISSISWGFWGKNGLWPSPELAEKEVRAAKTLGLNCLQFHRNPGKTDVLDAQDRLGLLRYMESGGGMTALGTKFRLGTVSPEGTVDTSGRGGDPSTFAEKFMEEKIIRMIRDHRSHPSLIIYCLQNEMAPDLRNPRIHWLLRRMHQEDPSRLIVLKSGIPARNQAWMKPYEDTVRVDRGDGVSGWRDQHSVGGPGVWQDLMYKSPTEFTHNSKNREEVVMWGEMLGSAVPDNHAGMVRQIEAEGGTSYDLAEHRALLESYESFLDRWNFRSAFKTAESLFLNIGDKSYDFWGRVIETARLSEANDYLVISGWESMPIENHSGLLDNLRNFKGNPALLRDRLAPIRPVIKVHSLVAARGENAEADLFLLNETGKPAGAFARLRLVCPNGETADLGRFPIPPPVKDRFVYTLAQGIKTPTLVEQGQYKLRLETDSENRYSSEETILVVDPNYQGGPKSIRTGVLSFDPRLHEKLSAQFGIQAEPFREGGDYQVVVIADRMFYGWPLNLKEIEIKGTDDDALYKSQARGMTENLAYTFTGLPSGKAKVTLKFAELAFDRAGARVFDVDINGKTALKDFDIFAAAGAKNAAVDREVEVEPANGTIHISIGHRAADVGVINAIKIEAGGQVRAINCGGEPYTDKSGLLWEKYVQSTLLTQNLLSKIRSGTGLLVLPDGPAAVQAYGEELGRAGVLTYQGTVGTARASWMGSWYFARRHPVFEGLPADGALKSYYQVPVYGSDGMLVEGRDVEVMVGYSRDHDRRVGAATFTVPYGKGKILVHTIPSIVTGLIDPGSIEIHAPRPGMTGEAQAADSMNRVVLRRLISNSLKYLDSK